MAALNHPHIQEKAISQNIPISKPKLISQTTLKTIILTTNTSATTSQQQFSRHQRESLAATTLKTFLTSTLSRHPKELKDPSSRHQNPSHQT